jgi:NAD(P) transhydrogenase subunit alpha
VEEAIRELQEAAEAAALAAVSLSDAARALTGDAPAAVAAMETAGDGAAAAAGVDPFVFRLAIFVLSIFIGYYVVWAVTPALHTPLMSVTNAISSVIVVGALIAVGADMAEGATITTKVFGFIALSLAAVNIFGGFLVTERMLGMYKPKEKK